MAQHAGHTPQAHDATHDEDHGLSAEQVRHGADDDDRRQAGDRDEHVQDTEHPTSHVLRQLFLELSLGRYGNHDVRGSDQEGDAHHQ